MNNLLEEKQKIDSFLEKSQRLLITSHINPDFDAFSCVLLFKWYVNKYFKNISSEIYFTGNVGNLLESLDFYEDSKNIRFVDDISDIVDGFDTLVILDASEFSRFTKKENVVLRSNITTICIDHHITEYQDYDYSYINTDYSSCVEILCSTLLSNEDLKDKNLSKLLLLGIYSDTGGLQYVSPNQTSVFSTVKRIIDFSKIDIQLTLQILEEIDREVFEIHKEYVLNARFSNDSQSVLPFSYSYVEIGNHMRSANNNFSGAENYVVYKSAAHLFMSNYLRKVKGYTWGFVVIPDFEERKFNISFRSLPNSVNVQVIAKLFNGGGHKLASGGEITSELLKINQSEFDNLSAEKVCEIVIDRIEAEFTKGNIPLV